MSVLPYTEYNLDFERYSNVFRCCKRYKHYKPYKQTLQTLHGPRVSELQSFIVTEVFCTMGSLRQSLGQGRLSLWQGRLSLAQTLHELVMKTKWSSVPSKSNWKKMESSGAPRLRLGAPLDSISCQLDLGGTDNYRSSSTAMLR